MKEASRRARQEGDLMTLTSRIQPCSNAGVRSIKRSRAEGDNQAEIRRLQKGAQACHEGARYLKENRGVLPGPVQVRARSS